MAIARASSAVSRENQGHGIAMGWSRRPSGRSPRVIAATMAASLQPPSPVATSGVRLRLYHTPHG